MLARARTLAAFAFVALIAAGAAHAEDAGPVRPFDPLEPMNRAIFSLNKNILDKYILIPIIKFHNRAIPRPARISIRNFFMNLKEPITAENDILQGSFVRAGQSLGRFGLNTTVGLVGLMDVAGDMGLKRHEEDFGQTLGTYGVGEGPYLVLPVLGPSSFRDVAGRVTDDFMDPFQFVQFRSKTYWTLFKDGATVVEDRAHKVKKKVLAGQANNASYESARARYLAESKAEVENKVDDDDEGGESSAQPPGTMTTPGAAPPPNLQVANIAPQQMPAEQDIIRQFRQIDLPVTGITVENRQLNVEIKTTRPSETLSCSKIWSAVNFGGFPGIDTVNVSTVGQSANFGCTKFLDSSVPTPSPAPAHSGPVGLPGM
jgi:phospholipid-binding lipoprotein MlaA